MSALNLAIKATRAAARVRAELGVGPTEGVCPFDLAAELEVPVRLVSLPSLEGMYSPEPRPTIMVSVERPAGRRRFTCGHELGHHVFGHGVSLDELAEEATATWTPEEFVAQRFAAGLLMPKLAVDSAFARRGWSISEPTSEMVFIVAQELGVGFTTLVGHLERTLGHIPNSVANVLRRVRLPKLRDRLAGFKVEHDLLVIDRYFSRRTIDAEVGDVLLAPSGAEFKGDCAVIEKSPVRHMIAIDPGVGQLVNMDDPPIPVRISCRKFTGLARYRHLEEAEDDL